MPKKMHVQNTMQKKHAYHKCKKNAGAKTQFANFRIFHAFSWFLQLFFQNHVCLVGPWSDLHLFFHFVFCIFCFSPRSLHFFFRNHVCLVGPWSDLHFFSLFPSFLQLFRNHVCPVGLCCDLHFFFAFSPFLSFVSFRVAFFNCMFFWHLFFLPLPDLHFSIPFFSIISPFFPRCRHLRTSAIRQHNTKWFVSSSRTCSGWSTGCSRARRPVGKLGTITRFRSCRFGVTQEDLYKQLGEALWRCGSLW